MKTLYYTYGLIIYNRIVWVNGGMEYTCTLSVTSSGSLSRDACHLEQSAPHNFAAGLKVKNPRSNSSLLWFSNARVWLGCRAFQPYQQALNHPQSIAPKLGDTIPLTHGFSFCFSALPLETNLSLTACWTIIISHAAFLITNKLTQAFGKPMMSTEKENHFFFFLAEYFFPPNSRLLSQKFSCAIFSLN